MFESLDKHTGRFYAWILIHTYILGNHIPKILCILLTGGAYAPDLTCIAMQLRTSTLYAARRSRRRTYRFYCFYSVFFFYLIFYLSVTLRARWTKLHQNLHRAKISWTLANKRLKMPPEFSPTLGILFRHKSIALALSGDNVAPPGESQWNGIGFVCSSDSKSQKISTWQWHHVGWP